MASEGVQIRVDLDVTAAKGKQRELDEGFRRSSDEAGNIGKKLFGGLNPLSALLSPIGASAFAQGPGQALGAAASGFGFVAGQEFAKLTGSRGYANRIESAMSAKDEVSANLGYASAFASTESLKAMYEMQLKYNDALAEGKRRMDGVAEQTVAQRATGGWFVDMMQRGVNAMPDSWFGPNGLFR